MNKLPKADHRDLVKTLKAFAFKQSPLFKNGTINAMDLSQAYYFIEHNPNECKVGAELDIDETRITLGFYALRHCDGGLKPTYSYELFLATRRIMHPGALKLSDDALESLAYTYFDEEFERDSIAEDIQSGELLEQIANEIVENGDLCEAYQSITYYVSTLERGVYETYERGVGVGDYKYDHLSTDDQYDYESNGMDVETAGDGTLFIAPRHGSDELEIGDEIEIEQQFLNIIRSLGLDDEAAHFGIGPQADKVRGLMFILECMKKRKINAY